MIHPIANHTAERNVLAATICNPRAFAHFNGHLNAADFDDTDHRAAWEAITRLHDQGLEINPRNVLLQCVNGIPELIAEEASYPSASRQWREWRDALRKTTTRRNLRLLGERLYQDAEVGDLNELTALVEAATRNQRDAGRKATEGKVLIDRQLDRVEQAVNGTLRPRGIRCGYQILDDMTDGLSGYVVLGARSSTGKSTYLCNVAIRLLLADARPVIFSAEMSEDGIGGKIMQAHCRIDWQRFRDSAYGDEKVYAIGHSARELAQKPWWVQDRAVNFRDIRREARRLVEREGARCVMIDYLQLLRAEGQYRSEYEALTATSVAISELKGELGVPVIVAAQLNREQVKGSANSAPAMHHLKGSGQIEQDADLILLLQREKGSEALTLIVEKQREGPTGLIYMHYDMATQRIEECQDQTPRESNGNGRAAPPRIRQYATATTAHHPQDDIDAAAAQF